MSSMDWSNFQLVRGYLKECVYWFKYEPLEWVVVDEVENGTMLVCNSIIDSQEFDYKANNKFSNNYAQSLIRSWLNQTFLNTAFDSEEQEQILITEVDNN